MAQFGRRRQVDRYDGQTIFVGNQSIYELGNYLGGGASGSVYQALDVTGCSTNEKSVAIKILNPLGYKILPYGQLTKCIVASKGQPLSQKQIHGKVAMTIENVWWLVHPTSEQVFAAYEDASRGQLRELTLPRCIEVWGWNPLGSGTDQLNPEVIEKRNMSGQSIVISNNCIVQIPLVAPKYLKWLQSRATVCREMNNMIHIGEHSNIVDLLEVLELIQDSKAVLFLVLEFVNGGELFDRMKRSSGPGTHCDEFARRYFSQLLSGIDYCHGKGVVHRDLKPENLLLSDPSDSAILKIADFGLSAVVFATEGGEGGSFSSPNPTGNVSVPSSQFSSPIGGSAFGSSSAGSSGNLRGMDSQFEYLVVTENLSESQQYNNYNQQSPIKILQSPVSAAASRQKQQYSPPSTPSPAPLRRLRSIVGSPHYIAPEIVNHDPCGYDGRKVDMWSAGVILYSLLTGSLPFGGDLSSCPRYKRYKQWMLSEYAPAVRDGKEVALPAWFFPPSISPIAGSLILSLIHIDPQQRCTAVEALKHPWSTGEGMEGSKRFTTQIKQIPHPTVAAPRLNIKPKPSISSSSTLSQASFTPAPLVPSSSVQSTPLSVPGSLTTCSRPVRTRSHPQSSPPIPILESVLEEPIEGERVSIINELRVLPLVPSSLPLVALSVPAEEAITVDERRVVDDIRCSNLFRDHQQGQGQSSVQSEATVTQPRADLVSVISVKINPVTPQYACTDRSQDNNSLLAAPLPISIVQSCSRPQLTPVASEGSSAGSGSGLRLCSNQTPNQANPSSDLLRREQVRERGKGRQEEERSDRYRSSLQQQRQKEEAALALDLQLCWDIDQISNFSPNLPREKK